VRPVGWGIVGCGRVAENRVAPAIKHAANSSLAAFCSRTTERAARFAQRFDAPAACDDLAAMLRDDRVEAVYLATPNALHAEQAIACLRAGRHVLTDKPMALSAADCERMKEAADASDRVLGVCHQQRFHPAHQACFRLVREGKLGRLTILRAQMGFLFQPSDQWRLQPALSGGGPGMDLAPHAVDILLQAAGAAARVAGRVANVRFDYPVEDAFFAQLDFAGGAIGTVETDYCSHGYGGRLEVRGDEGTFIAEGSLMAADRYQTWLLRGPSRTPVETHEGEHRECFRAAIEDFSGAIREQRRPIVSADDGIAVMRVIEAAYADARSKRAAGGE
jgi:1,5-anhydro-D-fructose reductase (1,5-anhydro-D-mannitol-forming)